jgi:protein required for attachment to host cells
MKTCVVVGDRSRARLFVSVPAPERLGATAGGSDLLEVEALTDPEGELKDGELFSTRGGSNRSPHGAKFGYDDHRQRHRDEEERRFARRVADAVLARFRSEEAARLVVAVEPRLLGLLRRELKGKLQAGVEVIEVAKDFSWHDAAHVRDALLRFGVMSAARPS